MSMIGFVGRGVLGTPTAGYLIAGGHGLLLDGHSAVPEAALIAQGATACASGRAVAEAATIDVTMVPGTSDMEAAPFGQDGVAASARAVGAEDAACHEIAS